MGEKTDSGSSMKSIEIAASILTADFSKLGEQIRELEETGIDMISFDVMDGHFVDNITMGPAIIKSCRKTTKLPFECHLMIEHPEKYIPDFLEAGIDIFTVHIESTDKMVDIIKFVRDNGKKMSIAIKLATPPEVIFDYLSDLDIVLVMSVNPGFAGKKFIDVSEKIRTLRAKIKDLGLNTKIMVDGGINDETAKIVKEAGADILVSASYIFNNDYKTAIETLRNV